jgi:mono/diheme cytochrome c family protein
VPARPAADTSVEQEEQESQMPITRVLSAQWCVALSLIVFAVALAGALPAAPAGPIPPSADGQAIFRYDTFGDEQQWTDRLRMHEVIQSAVSPAVALSVGLNVDSEALPAGFLASHDLNDPATTVELIRVNAVIGVRGQVDGGVLTSVGVTCALCHSRADDSVTTGIGRRLDGWANTRLNPGAIIALSPALDASQKAVYNSWGAGRYDPRFNIDGVNGPVVIPPAFGLEGVGFETYTGDGPVSYWNNYVAVTQMGGHGSFSDPRLGISIVQTPDLVTPKLRALVKYELSLKTPQPAAGSFDPKAARRGQGVFRGVAQCARCHTPPTYTDVLGKGNLDAPLLHDPSETGMDPVYASRSATGRYRATPLRALATHAPYFHDGSAPDLRAVVEHYTRVLGLSLSDRQKDDLVEFLKSL